MQKEIELTDYEKFLYNKHLAISRSIKNKPFKIKKNFIDVLKTGKPKFLKRLSTFFNKHPEIDPDVFFKSPYCLYPDVAYFDLEYFASMRAIKAYTLYKQQLLLQDPDTQLEDIKKSLRFMAKFCIDNNIQFYQYSQHKTADLYTWMIHYKENKINPFSLMEFGNIFSAMQEIVEDLRRMYVKDFVEQFKRLYIEYSNSSKIKPFLKAACNATNNFVYQELTKRKTP
jgi:hypothetical protein